jgi:hypothetical protein
MRFRTVAVPMSFAFVVCATTILQQAKGQQHLAANSAAEDPEAGVAPRFRSKPLQILYTGKLMGYFWTHEGQSPDPALGGCREKMARPSLAAQKFDKLVEDNRLRGVILVGTGDNFAPEVESRKFCAPPKDQYPAGKRFQRSGKEFFVWDGQMWRTNEYVTKPGDPTADRLRKLLRDGGGFIPNDNVADFFLQEGYAALVPGKHDFYYGAERLRELAWLLASAENKNTRTIHSEGVQMLGANLVIETTWKTGHETLSDRKEPPWFIPRFPTGMDLGGGTDVEIKLSGLSDGGNVYPWYQGPSFTLSKADDKLDAKVQSLKFYLCPATREGDPNSIPEVVTSACPALAPPVAVKKDGAKAYPLRFPWRDETKWSTLLPGQNYALCVDAPMADARLNDKKGGHIFCVRFSTYIPFLQYPAPNVEPCRKSGRPECRVPQPFVLLEKGKGLPEDVVIFGAVDPHLSDYVGLLNLSWLNKKEEYKTRVTVKEPSEALQEMDAYFEQKYEDEHEGKHFEGMKILLAQMSPQEAEVLGARLSKYRVIVSGADAERATYDHVTSMEWRPSRVTNEGGKAEVHLKGLMAVPEPFYDDRRAKEYGGAWAVDIGSLAIYPSGREGKNWQLKSRHAIESVNYDMDSKPLSHFWDAVARRVVDHCLLKDAASTISNGEKIQWLTLCAMQERAAADIAMLQRRDLFATMPGIAQDIREDVDNEADQELQDLVDRIIWKGDFVVLSYLPGSVIQKVMAQSKAYDSDDKSQLSLSDERNRGLVYVGLRYDEEQGEYLVNGVPLDPNKLYSVVTSDFVSGGDTGYVDLAGAQANAPSTPHDLDGRLWKISSVVCQKLAGSKFAAEDCLNSIGRDDYFDDSSLKPLNTKNVKTPSEQLENWSLFHHPGAVAGDPSRLKPAAAPSASAAADKTVEQRPLWDFAMAKWTLGITALGHNSSDYDVQNNFGGVSAPGVGAVRSSTWSSDMQAQYTRNWQHNQILVIPAYTFNTQYKGQPDDARQINQQTDLGMFDLTAVHLWNGRGPEHFDSIFSAHFETPLARIFNAFPLATTHLGVHGESIRDQLRFAQDRSYTELLRPGIRWLRRKSSAEIGSEWGHEWNALDGFIFITGGTQTPCLASATVSISQCVKNAVKANPQSITPTSEITSLRSGHDHAGIYWKLNLTVPFHPNVSYVFTDTGDWFLVHFHSDNSTDTRFRDIEQHQLKLTVFPSFSIGPEVDLLFYQNASTGNLAGHFLRQDTVMLKAQFNFDVFNGRKVMQEIKYAPPAPATAK